MVAGTYTPEQLQSLREYNHQHRRYKKQAKKLKRRYQAAETDLDIYLGQLRSVAVTWLNDGLEKKDVTATVLVHPTNQTCMSTSTTGDQTDRPPDHEKTVVASECEIGSYCDSSSDTSDSDKSSGTNST